MILWPQQLYRMAVASTRRHSEIIIRANVTSGATVSVTSGGSIDDFTVSAGGLVDVDAGGKSGKAITQPAHDHLLRDGETWSAVNVSGTTVYQSGATTISGPVYMTGASTLIVTDGATASGVLAADGDATITVKNGGLLESSTLDDSWLTVEAGGVTSANNINSVVATVYAGGSSINDNYYATNNYDSDGGAQANFKSGSTITGATVTQGAVISASKGVVISDVTVGSGGTFNNNGKTNTSIDGSITVDKTVTNSASKTTGGYLSGGTWSAVNVDGTTVYQSGSTVVSGAVYLDNSAKLVVTSGATASGLLAIGGLGTVVVQSGGTLENSTLNDGYLYVESGGITSANNFNSELGYISAGGHSIGDNFYNSGYDDNSIYVSSGGSIANANVTSGATVYVSSGANFDGEFNVQSGGSIWVKGTGETETEVCFLADTMIRTAQGDVAVQDLTVGDEVITYSQDGHEAVRKIIWAGKTHAMVRHGLPDDEAGYPVRIVKDAIAEGVPYKDLLVTAEHCLFFDGKFVPVRMLVNGRSIFYDKSITSYDYYHIETEEHSVIVADGMMTESYLDTGNRSAFRQEGKVASIGHGAKSWDKDAAYPLTVARELVEPIYHAIDARASLVAPEAVVPVAGLSEQHDLHLVTQNGLVIRQARMAGNRVTFMLPAGVETVSLVSRASRPSDTVGPFLDDRRQLGVLIGSISLLDGNVTHEITQHLEEADLSGWYGLETTPCRWTNGAATLKLGSRPAHNFGLLSVEILAAGPYIISNDPGLKTQTA